MPPKAHSVLAPSSKEWIFCGTSALFLSTKPEETNDAAEFGSECHALGEFYIRQSLKLQDYDGNAPKTVEELKATFKHYDEEMEKLANAYADFVVSTYSYEKEKNGEIPVILLEHQLEMDYSPDAKGTLDCGIISGDTLTIIDNKTGRKKVMAYWKDKEMINSQLGIYAYFAYRFFKEIYDIKKVRLVVFQERMNNTNEYTIDAVDLESWAETVMYPAAKNALSDNPTGQAGDHCEYCPGRNICRIRNQAIMQNAVKVKKALLMTDEEIEAILPSLDTIIEYCEDIKEYALKKALEGKRQWTGFKLIESETKRKITDEAAVAEILIKQGHDPYAKPKLIGIQDIQKRIGKALFDQLITPFVEKPKGAPKLVPESEPGKDYIINNSEDN